jgi:hypothetical protein
LYVSETFANLPNGAELTSALILQTAWKSVEQFKRYLGNFMGVFYPILATRVRKVITCSALALSTVLRTTLLSHGNMPFSGTHPTKTP